MGRPRFPDKAAVETLRQVAKTLVRTSKLKSENGKVIFKATLTKNEVTLIEFGPVKDETSTYIGLDDSLITSY